MATCPKCRNRFEIGAAQSLTAEGRTPENGPVDDSGSCSEPSLAFADRRCPVCVGETLTAAPNDLRNDPAPPVRPLVEERCAGCGGSLLAKESASVLVQDYLQIDATMLAELQSFTRATPLDCPSCSSPMLLLRLKGNDVDRCPSCEALWLDGGELQKLTAGRYGAAAAKSDSGSALPVLENLLGSLPRLKIRQDAEITASTVLVGWDHANYYDLRGPLGSIGVVAEKSQGVGSALLRNTLQSHRRLEAQWIDRSGSNVLLELDRPPWLFNYTMEVRSPALGRTVGRVRRHFQPIVRCYTLEDAMGRAFARIASPVWRFWTFPVLVDGAEKACIRKRWSGLFKEYYTRGDDFDLDFGSHGWTLEQRCLLVATAIAIDLDYFERRVAG
jgi:hypothetical protein